MLKIALKNAGRYVRLSRNPVLEKFLAFRVDHLPDLHDPEIAATLYGRFRVSGGTSKQTAPGRFRDLEEPSAGFLAGAPQRIHDVAVSSGITSVEMHSFLKRRGIDFHLCVSDKFSKYFLRGSLVPRIYDGDKRLLHAYFLGILADGKVSWRYPLSKALFFLIAALDGGEGGYTDIPLYDPRLVELIRSGDAEDIEFDLFATRIDQRFTFVRCMNVLNLSYFSEDKIELGLRLLTASLRTGGVLLLGRTVENGTAAVYNTATFYRKTEGGRLERLLDIAGGSELKALVEKMGPD